MFSDLKMNRCVLEIRYPKGHLYWDVCGKCILEINEQTNENIDFLRLEPDECILKFVENPKAQASFGVKHMTMTGNELRNAKLFKENGPLIFETVKKHLGIKQLSRVGFRMFYVLPKDSLEEAEKFVDNTSFYSLDVSRFEGFGNKVEAKQPVVTVSDGKTNVRIRLDAAKRTDSENPEVEVTEYSPRYAVLLDFDFYVENLNVSDFDLQDFIHQAEKKVKEHAAQILKK